MISYAQNFEDVLLWRALGHVENGFYIDVGACDPVACSVTKAFYDAGWRGINVEPQASGHQAFLAQRPRDINLACAAGAREGSATLFWSPANSELASVDSSIASARRAEGNEVVESVVPLRTLAQVCSEHVRGEIHFLKIDVEGFEGEVLRGMDFERWRPWVLVIEATVPNTRIPNHGAWESLVLGARYRFAYFDGLNRYYVAEEHRDLIEVLSVQANVHDGFNTHRAASADARAAASEARAAAADARASAAEDRAAVVEARAESAEAARAAAAAQREVSETAHRALAARVAEVEAQLERWQRSWSFRLTAPLRVAHRAVRRLFP